MAGEGVSKRDERSRFELFFPYYINQPRLLDLYALINGGYSDYEELEVQESQGRRQGNAGRGEVSAGFKLMKIGGSFGADEESNDSSGLTASRRVVQTPTTMLAVVLTWLEKNGFLSNIEESKPGSFVSIPVVLSINSIQSLFSEAKELVQLGEKMTSLESSSPSQKGQRKNQSNLIKQLESIVSVTRDLFGTEEIVYQADKYAIVGSISDKNLYQATRDDIIGVDLFCLAQIKKFFPEGTELLKNSYFSRLKDEDAKIGLIKAVQGLVNASFDFQATVVTEIDDKPVYQLEVVALFQLAGKDDKCESYHEGVSQDQRMNNGS